MLADTLAPIVQFSRPRSGPLIPFCHGPEIRATRFNPGVLSKSGLSADFSGMRGSGRVARFCWL
jgi:hypothetical protein